MKLKKIRTTLKKIFRKIFISQGGETSYIDQHSIESRRTEMLMKHYYHYPVTF